MLHDLTTFSAIAIIFYMSTVYLFFDSTQVYTPPDLDIFGGTWMTRRSGRDYHPTGLAQPAESACGFAAADQLWRQKPSQKGTAW